MGRELPFDPDAGASLLAFAGRSPIRVDFAAVAQGLHVFGTD
jgi:hypothetical protein